LIKPYNIENRVLKRKEALQCLITVLLSLSFILFIAFETFAGPVPVIKSIEVTGNNKISTATILSKIQSMEGTYFSKDTVKEDLKSLYKIGYFEDIRIEIESFEGGVKLIFNMIEKPSITSLDFQGNDDIDIDKLKENTTITAGAVANMSLILDNVQHIISYYQSEGFWLAKVVPIVREISDDAIALTYQIDEGPKVVIKGIEIEGNNAIADSKVMKAMKTKKRWLFSFITGSGIYKKDQIAQDLERIRRLYHSKGYIYVAISEPEIRLSSDKKKLFLKISLSEGDQYKIGEIKIQGNTVYSTEELFKQVTLSVGEIFNRSALRADIDRIIDMYMEKGYARADVNPLIDINSKEKTAHITLSISEGEIFRIGRIDVGGNTKTRDKVIRREMRLDEGDIFNKNLIKRSYQRINNLNFFETVDINPIPRYEDHLIDLEIKVKEKMTGMLSFGGGYSSIDKLMIMGEISQSNLFGKGYQLRLKADFSARRTNYNLSLKDPWFMDKPISASIGVYNDQTQFPDYDKKSTGGYIGFGKEFSEYVGGKISYNIEEANITDVSDDASIIIREQEGKRLTSSISPSIWRDTRDNYLDPTTGRRTAFYSTIAGLGGDNYFFRTVIDSVSYYPAFWKTTFSLRGRVGYASGYNGVKLPLYERFYVGGINTIRGLGFGEGGPRLDDEKIGGDLEAIVNAELIFPISLEAGLKGVFFFDYGGAFDTEQDISWSDVRSTAGFGARWMSPMGPMRLEWGFNIDPKDDEKSSRVEFSIGGLF
jgi:outer membrane protein insertion porin family